MTTAILSAEQLHRDAPSIYASAPWRGMSDRYKFVPTSSVIDILRSHGFHPVKAMQSRSRIEGKGEFTRHMLRFRHDSHLRAAIVGEETPELVLSNAHDGTSAYRLMAGIFRLVCGNGLTVQSADFGSISVKHAGGADFHERIIDATYQVVEEMPRTMEKIGEWKQIDLTAKQREAFAAAALELKGNSQITPAQLLAPRRSEDKKPDVWTTANVVQEHLIKGGLQGVASTGRRRMTTRPVKSVSEDLRLNRALWTLTEKLAEAVS